MKTVKEKADATVLICESNPELLKEYIEDHLDQWNDEMIDEIMKRLWTLQASF